MAVEIQTGQEVHGKIEILAEFPEGSSAGNVLLDGEVLASGVPHGTSIPVDTASCADGVHEVCLQGQKSQFLELYFHNQDAVAKPEELRKQWLGMLGQPRKEEFRRGLVFMKGLDHGDFTAKLFRQENGAGTWQRVLFLYPKNLRKPAPAVMVPFYYPEAMAHLELEHGADWGLEQYPTVGFGRELVRRGFVVAMSETYHLTYIERARNEADRGDFSRWRRAAALLAQREPGWTGMGKLVHDTSLVLDALEVAPEVDASRIGIIGHSLGGKMAFYSGCLDARVKAVVASDFGMGWGQTNWGDPWYWGRRLAFLRAAGFEHSQLLAMAAPKPVLVLAGLYDDAGVNAFYAAARPYYAGCPERLQLIHHATGHRPTPEAEQAAYQFLEANL